MQTYYPIRLVLHPEIKKKKELVPIPLNFLSFFISSYFMYLFFFF